MNILIVEDEILIQKSLKKLLEKKGMVVTATTSGIEAVKLISTVRFDRIICDLMLNDITGFDIIEESKNSFSLEEISKKFIIITAYSSEQVLNQAKQYNCRIFNKPFENISNTIEEFIK